MWRSLYLVGVLVAVTEAFAPAPIRWAGVPGQKLVLTPRGFPNRGLVPPQKLTVARHVKSFLSATPHFTVKLDRTIFWDAMGWCIEADAEKNGDVVQLNRCTGGPGQRWSWMPSGQGQMMIQLSGTNKCLDVADQTDSDGAFVGLRKCDDQISDFWSFGEAASPELSEIRGPHQQFKTLTPVLVAVSFVALAALVAFRIGDRLWRRQGHACLVAKSHGASSPNIHQGGMTLISLLSRHGHIQRAVPAAMAIGPAEEDARNADEKTNPASVSSYAGTSAGVRGLVSSLTGIVNAIAGAIGMGNKNSEVTRNLRPISTSELLDGVRADYVDRMYLWTGDIDADLYEEDCLFTDPTLSFQGLSTFQQNIANLQPILKALVKNPQVDLFSCELDVDSQQVRARWRMEADIALPWRPAINLCGRTTFTYDPDRGNRIVDYAEEWDLEAGAVLMQLLRTKEQA